MVSFSYMQEKRKPTHPQMFFWLKPFGRINKFINSNKSMNFKITQVIQAVTLLSPILGGHQQPFKLWFERSFNHSQKITIAARNIRNPGFPTLPLRQVIPRYLWMSGGKSSLESPLNPFIGRELRRTTDDDIFDTRPGLFLRTQKI